MNYRISIGAFDLANVKSPVVLKQAQGGEEITLIMEEEPTILKKGEIAYFDEKGPYNLDFNYRDAERTKVTEKTTDLIINVDGVYEANKSKVEQSLSEAVSLIQKFCGGEVTKIGIIE